MIIDREMAAPNKDGLTHLDWLQEARRQGRPDRLAFFAFDLLCYDGFDLRQYTLEERIAIIDDLIAEAGCPCVISVGYVIGGGAEFFAKARTVGAEGAVGQTLHRRRQPALAENEGQ